MTKRRKFHPMDIWKYKLIWAELISTKRVVERVRGMLSSDVFPKIKSHPTLPLEESDLRDLEKTLSDLSAAIPNLYRKIHTSQGPDLSFWLFINFQEVKVIALDLEDVLDVSATTHLIHKVSTHMLLPQQNPSYLPKLLKKLHSSLICIDLEENSPPARAFLPNRKEDTAVVPPAFLVGASKTVFASSLYDQLSPWEDIIVGRESEKEDIINYIFRTDFKEHPNIVCFRALRDEGIGKTTLGKLVCNDVRVSSSFDLVLRPIASSRRSKLDVKSTVVDIIRSVTPQSRLYPQETDLQQLKAKLSGILQGQKYLLVLDDFPLGYDGQTKWKELREIFEAGSTGSTVILISKKGWIGNSTKRVHISNHDEDQSRTLFTRCAAIDETTAQHPFFMGTGISIADKCRGNPLAIKTLGSTLRTNRNEDTWKQVNGSLLWGHVSDASSAASVAMQISIEYMSHDLLQCFLTSAVLFEDHKAICRDELIYFWMAHGLFRSSKGNEDLRDVGDTYCNELLWRAFLQVYHTDHCNNVIFQMHGEARNIAKQIVEGERLYDFYDTVFGRHILWNRGEIPFKKGDPMVHLGKARTFLYKHCTDHVSKRVLEGLISKLRLARVLLLDHTVFEELPEAIGSLQLLRYLSLVGNHRLQGLPQTICNLVNLQTLDLTGCLELKTLPRDMHKIESLWHLLLSVELNSLPADALQSWTSLHHLKICYSKNLSSLPEGISSLAALRVLWIHDCSSVASLPNSINCLTNLKELRILNCQSLDLTGWDGLDGLRCLENLQFQGLPKLTEFPGGLQSAGESLQHLVVSNCENLKALPECLQQCKKLLELVIDGCPNLVCLPRGIDAFKTLQVQKIFHSPNLIARCEREREDTGERPPSSLVSKGQPSAEHPYAATGIDTNVKQSTIIPVTHHSDSDAPNLETQDSNNEILGKQVVEVEKEEEGKHYSESRAIQDESHNSVISSRNFESSLMGILFLFAEGYEFEKMMLIQLWMALELITAEEIGVIYFKKLVDETYILGPLANSLYKVNTEELNNTTELNMIRDMQNYATLDNGFRTGNKIEKGPWHISVTCDEDGETIFEKLKSNKQLKTLLFLGDFGSTLQKIPVDLFVRHEFLVALDLSGTHIKDLPSCAGGMIHLRYLDLSWTLIELLPERIVHFKKLQTLKLKGCTRLRRLPTEMKKLTELRHLDVDVLEQLASFPKGMGALEDLRTMSAFPVGTVEGLKITELKKLNKLEGEFCIAKLENVQSANEAKGASLSDKLNIKKLKLRWSDCHCEKPKNEDESILDSLRPNSKLEKIQILCYHGTNLPSWIVDTSFTELKSITLFRCVHISMLPSLEKLPALETLELVSLNSVTNMDFRDERQHVTFPKLKKLEVDEMLNLETWTEVQEGDYPCLVDLTITDCPKLHEIPILPYLPSIKNFEVSVCDNLKFTSEKELSSSLEQLIIEDCPIIEERCSKNGGEDWHKIQHVPTIWIDQVPIQTTKLSRQHS